MEVYFGTICAFGFNFAPYGWATCTGGVLPIRQYTALFSLLGTNFGGDGKATFGLPDLQGRAAIGMGQNPGLSDYEMGDASGQVSVTLTNNNLPPHSHTANIVINGNSTDSSAPTPGGNFPGAPSSRAAIYSGQLNTPVTMGVPITLPTLAPAGSNTPIDIRRPYQAISYCISMTGIFPQRQ